MFVFVIEESCSPLKNNGIYIFAIIFKYTLTKLLGLLLLVNEPFVIVVKVALLKLDHNKFKYVLTCQ